MDFRNKILSPSSCIGDANHFLSGSERKKCSKKELVEENDENCEHVNNSGTSARSPKKEESKMFMSKSVSSTTNTNILTERNSASDTFFEINPQLKPSLGLTDFESSRQIITPHSIGTRSLVDNSSLGSHFPSSAPYDPATNYTSPRPEFLRYNPNRKREILSFIEQEMEEELEYRFRSSSSSDTEKLNTKGSSSHSSVSCQLNLHNEEFIIADEDDSDVEDNEIEEKERYTGLAWKLFLLFGVLASSFCYISSMNSIADTYSLELGVIGRNLKNTRDWAFPRKAYIGAMLGFSNVCLHASLSEFTCRIDGNLNEGNDYERKELKGIQHVESLFRSKSNNVNEAENERDEIIKDETLGDAHSVAEGKVGETGYVNDSIAPGRSTFESGDENGDSDASYNVITDESFQAAPIEVASLNWTVDEEARPDLITLEVDETSLDD
ncbi:uncharacterized protein LOC109717846 [Ananas comosus]|uniref:Uncharacterized protein LOC109717846 n=1 Tax=Ananas comosus TaxID=4615 RepID=A0A6P5FTT9_ANACO|nr:uncharacterized protein LOC109717846 [Ananas comosus]